MYAEALFADDSESEARAALDRFALLVHDQPTELARLVRRYTEWDFNLAALDLLDEFEPATEDEPELAFLRGKLLLEATTDFDGGVAALELALQSGYRDRDAYEELILALSEDEIPILIELLESYDVVLGDEEDEIESEQDEETVDPDQEEASEPEEEAADAEDEPTPQSDI